jgi:hypothetical protein
MNSPGFPGSLGQTFGDAVGASDVAGLVVAFSSVRAADEVSPRGTISLCFRQYRQNV